MIRRLFAVAGLLALPACAVAPPPSAPMVTVAAAPQPAPPPNFIRAPLYGGSGGTPRVDVAIDGVCCFKFIVDSGASDVSVSVAIFKALINSGRITKADMIDVVKYQTAAGVSEGLRFRLPPLTVGGRTVYGVIGSVSPDSNMLLLGQSFLKKFRFWAIDNNTGTLVLGG